jgi:general secretion pathway protein J
VRNKGFTLIELVIAFTISLLIILIIISGFRLSMRSYEKISERENSSQKIRVIYDRVGWLIKGIYPFKLQDKKSGKEKIFFKGTPDAMGFVTTSVMPDSERIYDMAGLKWAYIYVDNEGLKEKDQIFFNEDNLESSEGEEILLDPDVESIEIEYFDPEARDWVDEWDTEKEYFPSAIKLRLKLSSNGKTIIAPEMIFSLRISSLNP